MKKDFFEKMCFSMREPFDKEFKEVGCLGIKSKQFFHGVKNCYKFNSEMKRIKNKIKHNIYFKKSGFKAIGGGFKRAISIM